MLLYRIDSSRLSRLIDDSSKTVVILRLLRFIMAFHQQVAKPLQNKQTRDQLFQ